MGKGGHRRIPQMNYLCRRLELLVGSELLRTPFGRSSQNYPSETVWKIGSGPEMGVPKAADRGSFDPSWPLFAAEEARSIDLRLFSKQFLHALR
jgi:hypothetical protein